MGRPRARHVGPTSESSIRTALIRCRGEILDRIGVLARLHGRYALIVKMRQPGPRAFQDACRRAERFRCTRTREFEQA